MIEPRKIQISGGSTYTVSIPKQWVEKLGINAGDYVSLQLTRDKHLLLRPDPAPRTQEKRAVVRLEGQSAVGLRERLMGFYLAGHNTIEVRGSPRIDSRTMAILRDLPRKVSGLELVQATENMAVLEDLIDPSRFSLTMALERMYALLRGSLVRSVDGLLDKSNSQRGEAISRLHDIERLSWIVLKQQRMIVENPSWAVEMGVEPVDAIQCATCAQSLKGTVKSCYNLIELVSAVSKSDIEKSALLECVEVGHTAISQCDKGFFAFTRGDTDTAEECLARQQDVERRMAEVRNFVTQKARSCGCAPCLDINKMLDLLGKVSNLAENVAELTFHRAAL